MKVSFDFDGTLSRQEVQDYAKSLINKGINVFIVTARFNELRKGFYKPNPTNDDLWEVCKKVGIPERNVIFCNMEDKSFYLMDSEVKFHLDDCWVTIKEIEANAESIPVIDVNSKDWKKNCKEIIKEHCKVDETFTKEKVSAMVESWRASSNSKEFENDIINKPCPPSQLNQAISAIEDFSHSSQLPYPEDVKQMMLREEFPKLVQQLREAFENLKPKENVNAIPRKSAFPIRGTIRTT